MPVRGGGGLLNGLNDDSDDEDYVDEDSDELLAIKNTGNRLGGQKVLIFCSLIHDPVDDVFDRWSRVHIKEKDSLANAKFVKIYFFLFSFLNWV
jgi:hypothetical protein